MPRRTALVAFVVAASFLPAACTKPIPPESPSAVVVPDPEIDALWEAALSVLARLDLWPEVQDRATGTIETLPATSQQFWEFWRRDVADRYSFAQASLQTIRRKATVRFRKDAGNGRWRVIVQVDVSRLESPERQMTSTSSALALYTAVLPTTEGLLAEPFAATYWEPLGRDAAMEQLILDRILRVAGTADYEFVEPSVPADEDAAKSG